MCALFKDGHEEIRFLELRRFLRVGERVGRRICRDNDLLIFNICKRLIRATFGGDKTADVNHVDVVREKLIVEALIQGADHKINRVKFF